MKQLLVIVGLPGSGKDTQIESLAKRKKFEVIRVGDLVREKAKTDPQVAEDLAAGNLADNAMVNQLIDESIRNFPEQSYIISDGFPRDLEQAEWLVDYLHKGQMELVGALHIKISDEVALQRLTKRGRDDDQGEIIVHRLQVFHKQTGAVVEFFRSRGKLMEIDGSGTPDEVERAIKVALGW